MQTLPREDERIEILRLSVFSFVEAHKAGDDLDEQRSAHAIALMGATDAEIREALIAVREGWRP